jgi:carbon storage regulator
VVEYLRVFCHVGFFLALGKHRPGFEVCDSISSRRIAKMLILSRRNSESIVIDGGITIKVLAIKGNVVRLGIEAPKKIQVHRTELYERIRENERTFASPNEKS